MMNKILSRQLRKPEGFFGKFIGNRMARRNEFASVWTVSLLNIAPEDHILEIGFGPGVGIEQSSGKAVKGLVAGIDYSETMIEAARKRNSLAIKENRVDLRLGNVASLPFGDNSFDKAYSIHCIYFWSKPAECLKELFRVLKPEGILAITIYPKEKWTKKRTPSADIFTLYNGNEVKELLLIAGFNNIRIETSSNPDKFRGESILGLK
jgi:ubiquinone/menaquinone biosynthesis C-methylase UbiE